MSLNFYPAEDETTPLIGESKEKTNAIDGTILTELNVVFVVAFRAVKHDCSMIDQMIDQMIDVRKREVAIELKYKCNSIG
tara:strand:- start:241 stop:480 length:240 start_codon:yes stop_codon:yes gene_type:complete